ncbi:MAG: hypothetical protein WKF37_05855 [Bryobacteraceae bacterium]
MAALIPETSTMPNAGRVSIVTAAGVRRTFLEGLPSGTEVAGGGSGPNGLARRDRTVYVALGAGDTERRTDRPGITIHNPQGASSPLFSSVLTVRLSQDPDNLTGPFRLTVAHQQTLSDGGEVQLDDGNGSTATIGLLTQFPIAEPDPNLIYRF